MFVEITTFQSNNSFSNSIEDFIWAVERMTIASAAAGQVKRDQMGFGRER